MHTCIYMNMYMYMYMYVHMYVEVFICIDISTMYLYVQVINSLMKHCKFPTTVTGKQFPRIVYNKTTIPLFITTCLQASRFDSDQYIAPWLIVCWVTGYTVFLLRFPDTYMYIHVYTQMYVLLSNLRCTKTKCACVQSRQQAAGCRAQNLLKKQQPTNQCSDNN